MKTLGIPKLQMMLFPNETSNILLHDSGQWFCLDPFGDVVNSYDEELMLPYGNEEGSYYVQSPLGEWLGGAHWCKLLRWLSHDVAEVLVLVICLHVGLGILLHSRSVVSGLCQLVN